MPVAFALASLALVPSPALAVPPLGASNFHPQASLLFTAEGGNAPDRLVISDKYDGIDQLAHITSVATPDSTQAIYVLCPPGTISDGSGPTPVPPPGCAEIGRDLEGVVPGGIVPGGNISADKAYELLWDVTPFFDGILRDFVSYHCTFGPTAAEPGDRCVREVEQNVVVDDAHSPTFDSSTGEILDWCVDAPPLTGDCDSFRHPFGHPETIPSNFGQYAGGRLIVRALFSADVNQATLCVDTTADAFNRPNECDASFNATIQAAPAFATGTFSAPLGAWPANSEMAFFLYENDTGAAEADDEAGYCDSTTPTPPGTPGPAGGGVECVLDAHYVVSSTPGIVLPTTHVYLHNDENPGAPGDQGPTLCETAGRAKDEIVTVGDTDQVIGCIFEPGADPDGDGNADPTKLEDSVESTMELQGGGLFTECEGTISASGTSCHFDDLDSAAGGPDRKYEAEWRSMIPESSTVITFCVDPDNNGCGDSGARDFMIKVVAAGPAAHVHVLETEQANGPHGCHPVGTTGSIQANVRSKVALTGCVFEESHVPDADARVAWEIRTAGVPHPGGVDPAKFGAGLDKRADDDGRALGVVSTNPLASGHTTTVTFCRDADSDGACGSGDPQKATVRISWTGKGCTSGSPGGDSIDGTGQADCLKGGGGADDLSAGGARDFVFGGAGDDTLRGGGGADVLAGGPGFDVCYGQAQRDTFVSCERKRTGG